MSMPKPYGDADVFKAGVSVPPLVESPTIGNEMASLEDTPANALSLLNSSSVEESHVKRRARVAEYGK